MNQRLQAVSAVDKIVWIYHFVRVIIKTLLLFGRRQFMSAQKR